MDSESDEAVSRGGSPTTMADVPSRRNMMMYDTVPWKLTHVVVTRWRFSTGVSFLLPPSLPPFFLPPTSLAPLAIYLPGGRVSYSSHDIVSESTTDRGQKSGGNTP